MSNPRFPTTTRGLPVLSRSPFALIAALAIAAPARAEDAPVETTAAESASVWKASCEAGFTLTEGNSSTRAASGSCSSAHSSGKLTVGLSAAANYGKARYGGLGTYPDVRRGEDNRIPRGDFIESVRNFFVGLHEEYALTDDGRLDVYAIEAWESDIFKGFDARWRLEAGLGYAYVETESQTHRVGVGLQYENEQLIVADAGGREIEHRFGGVLSALGTVALGEAAEFEYKVSYQPNLLDARTDWRLGADAAVIASVNSRLALKVGGKVEYDNDPSLIAPRDPFGIEVAGATAVPARKTDSALYSTLVLTIH